MFNWLSKSFVAHVCFEVVFAIVAAFLIDAFLLALHSFSYPLSHSLSVCMHSAAVCFSSSDAKLCVRTVFIEFTIFIMYDGGSGSFILCMHKTINNNKENPPVSRSHKKVQKKNT